MSPAKQTPSARLVANWLILKGEKPMMLPTGRAGADARAFKKRVEVPYPRRSADSLRGCSIVLLPTWTSKSRMHGHGSAARCPMSE